MQHEHKVEFPQVKELKQHAQDNRQLYIGLGIGILLGYYLKGRSCDSTNLRVFFISP
jgi:hypothetical protein